MANADNEPDPVPATREPPPRAVTRLSALVRRLVAPNPSPFTFNGTCSYIVGEARVAIVDPGPDDDAHLAALLAAVDGRQVEALLITHTHRDHSPGARKLKAATGARVIGAAPFAPSGDGTAGLDSAHDRDYAPDAILADGERWQGAGYTIEAIATPGHCSNHLCFALLEENALLSGDHVMAWSTSVVAPPDGSMRAYMASLGRLRARPETIYWPGHGGPVVEPQRYLRALIHHRRQREASILNALANGPQTIPALVARIYVGLNPSLTRAAGLSTLAHLEDLAERGRVVAEGEDSEPRFRLA
ncbi:MAG TPA: MBL fold metallo-hydrolase [Roseiarcus sp.]|jgi:glyoxylase-like metal-dependent hydrolase (beta-lactamase superfamily II)